MNDNLETVQLLPLTSDIVFKQVFGQEESKPILRKIQERSSGTPE